MKILFVADTYYPHINGVYYFVERLALLLKNEGHEVAVLTPSETVHHCHITVNNVDVFGVASFSLFFYRSIRIPIPFSLQSHLTNIFETFKPDIIHLQNHFILNKAVIKANKKNGFPLIATNHFMTENLTSLFKSSFVKTMLKKWLWGNFTKVFNKVILVTTPTETAADLIRTKLKVPVITVSNGIDLKKFYPGIHNDSIREKFKLPAKPILLYVGRLDPEKNIDQILHAIADIKNTNFCFVIAGKGIRKDSLQTLVSKLGLEKQVFFTGYVSDEDLLRLYQSSYCFITASIAELQSLATMEAMASGLPVIAARAGALMELVHEHENGFLFSPGDIKAISKYIEMIFGNNELRSSMGSSSLSHISQHAIEKTVVRYKSIYEECIEKKPSVYPMTYAG